MFDAVNCWFWLAVCWCRMMVIWTYVFAWLAIYVGFTLFVWICMLDLCYLCALFELIWWFGGLFILLVLLLLFNVVIIVLFAFDVCLAEFA